MSNCGGSCTIAFIGDSTQCTISRNVCNTTQYIYIQEDPNSSPTTLTDAFGTIINPDNIIPNNTGHPIAALWSIAKHLDILFVVVRYYTPQVSGPGGGTHKLVKLRLNADCTASVLEVKDNFVDSRSLCAVDKNTLLVAEYDWVRVVDLNGTYTYNYGPMNGVTVDYDVTTLFSVNYGLAVDSNPHTQTNPYNCTSYQDTIEDLVYIPMNFQLLDDNGVLFTPPPIVAVLINQTPAGLSQCQWDPEILTYQINDWVNYTTTANYPNHMNNPQLGASGPLPTSGGQYEERGNMSLYCYDGNLFTHNSQTGLRMEWELNYHGDIQQVFGAFFQGVGHLGYGDAGSTPECCSALGLVDPNIAGCTDPTAQNYNPAATIDDGSCIATVYGCTDPAAINYYAGAQVDDGSCCYTLPCNPVVPGCTDSTATNYNPAATIDDGSCTYPPPVNPCKELWTINPTLVQSCCEWCEENALIPGGLYGPPPPGCYDWHCDCCKPPIIKKFDLDLSDIPAAGESRTFTITGEGDGEVEFELRVRDKDNGKYYNFVTNLFQTEETSLEDKIK
jgi:hypothetical protein